MMHKQDIWLLYVKVIIMQVAMIAAAPCTPIAPHADPHLVCGDGGCSCMLLLPEAGPDLCTLHPDLFTLCLWCFLSTSTNTPLARVVVSPFATCAGGVFPFNHLHEYCICTQTTRTVWWYTYLCYVCNIIFLVAVRVEEGKFSFVGGREGKGPC